MADQIDPEIIRQLNEKFTELTNLTLSNLSARMDKHGTAIQDNTAAFNKNTDSISKNTDANDKQSKSVEKTTDATDEQTKVIKKSNQAYEKQKETVDDNKKSLKSLKEATDTQYKAYQTNERALEAIRNAQQEVHDKDLANQRLRSMAFEALTTVVLGAKKVFDAAIDAQVQYTKELLAGQRGLRLLARQEEMVGKAANQVVRDLSKLSIAFGGLMIAMGPFGLIGRLAGAAAVGLGLLGEYTAKASDVALELKTQLAELKDRLFESFNDLSNASLTSAQGMTGLNNNLQKLMMGMADVGKFSSIIKGAGKELALIGPTAVKGVDNFADVAGELIHSNLGKELEYMGINNERQAEHVLKFMALQTRLGLAQERDTKKLAMSAGQYVKELDQLAALTGATRQEQEQAREQILSIEELRASMMEAEVQGDKERQERLGKALQTAEAMYIAGAKEAAGALAKTVAAGAPVTPEAVKLQIAAPEFVKKVMEGTGTVSENLVLFGKELKTTLSTFSSAGKISYEAIKDVLIEGYKVGADFATTMKKAEDYAKEKGMSVPKALEELRKVTDEETKKRVDLEREQREKAIAAQTNAVKELGTAGGLLKKGAEFFGVEVGNFGKYVRQLLGIKEPTPLEKTEAEKKAEAKVTEKKGVATAAETKAMEASKKEDLAKKELADALKSGDVAKVAEKRAEIAKLSEERVKAEQELMNASRAQTQAALEATNARKKALRDYNQNEDKLNKAQENIKLTTNKLVDLGQQKVELEKEVEKTTGSTKRENENRLRITKQQIETAEKELKTQQDNLKLYEDKKKELEKKTVATPVTPASTQEQKEFMDKMYNTLLDQAKKQGVANPEIIARLGVAQSAIETGYGKSTAGGQNYFGIKAGKGQASVTAQTEEYDAAKGAMVKQQAAFRKYGSMEESAADYVKFLKENQRYKDVLAAKTLDEAIVAQSMSGYATDPRYGEKLAKVASKIPDEPPKMFDGGVVTKPMTATLRDGGQDEAVIPLNRLAELIPIKELVDAINRQTELMASSFDDMKAKLDEGNSIGSDQLLYMQG